ncbi:MAG: hypothetical protein C4294_20065, partial [Nitrospiraceae bacterium]
MMYGIRYLYWFCVVLSIVATVVIPLSLCAFSPPPSKPRRLIGSTVAFVLITLAVGFYVYMFIPAQYVRDLKPAWPPSSNSLGEIHFDYFQRLQTPDAIAPANALALY